MIIELKEENRRDLLVKLHDICTDIDDHREGIEYFVSQICLAFGLELSETEIMDILGDDYKPWDGES